MLSQSSTLDISLLANAVETTQTSFVIVDHTLPDDPIIYCNSAFERLTGYDRNDIIGKNCRFLQRDDRRQPELVKLAAAIANGRECTVRLRNYRKDGSPFLNELAVSPVFSASGTITHLIGIQRDVTADAGQVSEIFYHELRTPLTIVKSTLQILQRKGLMIDPAFFNKSLETAVKAIDRLEKITNYIEKK
ncbi:PAS domain-containing protein [Mucilaginibacter sp. L3T2-6]|uniref:PAS domain-containing protein n=1 Tax=Mucilaginibacter sp. L3T2-6 TaxID=3062491 RepID=UPI002675BBE5|nr:PAS domain-containing protein [Mucilaginibacter sp. L3T2-6]MDO3641396.1 PAS domain-containing protein [Mucilaginibacter sp. L3T2-6]MDV6213843.1 PAS domain-containing protein [Mucilaginibacter sp. L3T2-6]